MVQLAHGYFKIHMKNIISLLFMLHPLFCVCFVGKYMNCTIGFDYYSKFIDERYANTLVSNNLLKLTERNHFNNYTNTISEDNFSNANYTTYNNALSYNERVYHGTNTTECYAIALKKIHICGQHFKGTDTSSTWHTKSLVFAATIPFFNLSIVSATKAVHHITVLGQCYCETRNELIGYIKQYKGLNSGIKWTKFNVKDKLSDRCDLFSTYETDNAVYANINSNLFLALDDSIYNSDDQINPAKGVLGKSIKRNDISQQLDGATLDPTVHSRCYFEHLRYNYVSLNFSLFMTETGLNICVFIVAVVAFSLIIVNTNVIQYSTFYLAVVLVYAHGTCAQNVMQKLLANDRNASDQFGGSVSVWENYLVVGAKKNDNFGSAYVFNLVNGNWNLTQKLLANDGSKNDYFGVSVDIWGNYLVVGAYSDDNNKGSVYVFNLVNSKWTQTQKLSANDGSLDDYFGYRVAIWGNYLVVGCHNDDDKGGNSGSAYVFNLVNAQWTQTQKLLANDGATDDHFGISVAIWQHYILVGAYADDDLGDVSGSAYVFQFGNGLWTQTQKLLANNGNEWDNFGYDVAIWGNYSVIGAYWDADKGTKSGSAHIFELVNGIWNETQLILANDGDEYDQFGYRVAMWQQYIVVSAYWNDDHGFASGSVYVFNLLNGIWTQTQKILANDISSYHEFGISIAIWQNYLVVGALLYDYSGSVYVMHSYDSCSSVWEEAVEKHSLIYTHYNYLINFTWTSCDFTGIPTVVPTIYPTTHPTISTTDPTNDPTTEPTIKPTYEPTYNPTNEPTRDPTNDPTNISANNPTFNIHSTDILKADNKNSLSSILQTQWFLFVVIIGVIVLILIILIILYFRKANQHRMMRANSELKSLFIQNPMVILVGIGDYDEEPQQAEFDGYVGNLDVNIDITNLWKLFHDELKYDTFPKYDDPNRPNLYWKRDDLIHFLKEKAVSFEYHVKTNIENTNKNKRNYDGLIVAVSSHGVEGGRLITSDYGLIHKDVIHRIFTSYHVRSREVPRIILYDCCAGDEEKKGIKKNKNNKKKLITDVVKTFTVNDIIDIAEEEMKSSDANDTGKTYTTKSIEEPETVKKKSSIMGLWERYTKNPDNKLVTAHASNSGFQSKMNSTDGSYFTSKFVDKTMNSLANDVEHRPFLHEIFDEIQEELGATKQLPVITYNNKTQYVKFSKNNNVVQGFEDDENDHQPNYTNNKVIEMVLTNTKDKDMKTLSMSLIKTEV